MAKTSASARSDATLANQLAIIADLVAAERTTKWALTQAADQVASAAQQNTTELTVTPTYPAGATEVRFLLLIDIHVASRAAAIHHIGLRVRGRKQAGAWATYGSDLLAEAVLGLVEADGAADGKAFVVDVSALIDQSAVQYGFRFNVDSDNAGAVTYTTGGALIMVYTI